VAALHDELDAIGGPDVETIGVMPNWHMRAHEGYAGPSPGSFPRPVYPDQVPTGWTERFYQPVNARLDVEHLAREGPSVPVAILDTRVDLAAALAAAKGFKDDANNTQLLETVSWLKQHSRPEKPYLAEYHDLEQHHCGRPAARAPRDPATYQMADHAVFVAGLIHGTAPRAPIALEPVLDETGMGDLSLLLVGVDRILRTKKASAPQIINMSLGFRPHPARLPAAWYGLDRPYDRGYRVLPDLADAVRNRRWVVAHRRQVGRTVDLLEAGLRELIRYLSLNNCLVIAAAGNDSLAQVEARQARFEPRLPARFDSALGVAATTSNPRQAARYSNVGDEAELGDHVATFGGNAADTLEPEDGVIGAYSGAFPDGRPNETGWAYWSGTSFATGIMSGIVANYWATRAKLDAPSLLAELNDEATIFGPYVPALRTPSIEVRGRWRR
jgi:subtilisin family serine protease